MFYCCLNVIVIDKLFDGDILPHDILQRRGGVSHVTEAVQT